MVDPLQNLESFFLALSDTTRLRIINLIGRGEVSVGDLVEALGESQPKVSRHLAYLRSAGVVTVRRDGKWIYYRLAENDRLVIKMLDDLLEWFEAQPQLSDERSKAEMLSQDMPMKSAGRERKSSRKYIAPAIQPTVIAEDYEEVFVDETGPEDIYEEPYIEQEERAAEPPSPPVRRQDIETFLL
jgi:ArsR family transcriptional regulator